MALTPPPAQPRQPAELLAQQAESLQQINANLQILIRRQEQLAQLLQNQGSRSLAERLRVTVEDINMPFMSMVGLLVKWALASIPATLILMVVFGCLFMTLSIVLGGLGAGLGSVR